MKKLEKYLDELRSILNDIYETGEGADEEPIFNKIRDLFESIEDK